MTEIKTLPVRDFLDLCDVPSTYTGQANKVLSVNLTEDGLIFSTVSSGTVTSVTATSPLISSGGTTPNISTSISTNRLIGRATAGTGVMEQITLGTGLSFSGTTLNASSLTTSTLAQVLANGNDADSVGVINDDSSLSSIEINGRRLNSNILDNYIDWGTGEVFTGVGGTQPKANFYDGELIDGANITVDWINRSLSFGNWTTVVSHTTPILIMTGVTTRNQSVSLADDATYTVLKGGAAGKVTAMCYENVGAASIDGFIQFIFVAYPSSGTGILTQIAASDAINAATSDSDGFLCAYMTGEDITIKNRLGASRNIMIIIDYF